MGALHHVSDLDAAYGSASQVVVPVKKTRPYLRFLRIAAFHRRNGHRPKFLKAATEFGNGRLNGIGSSFKTVSLFLPRQVKDPGPVQFHQCFPAAHLFQPSVRRAPVEPPAHPPGQIKPRNGWFSANCLLDPIEHRAREMLTADIHKTYIPSSTPCVKCVQRSGLCRGWMILNTAMKKLALGGSWATKNMKAIRFALINLPGRIVDHARDPIIRLVRNYPSFALLVEARQRIMRFAPS